MGNRSRLRGAALAGSLIVAGTAGGGFRSPVVDASTLSDFELLVDINQVNADSRPDNFLVTSAGIYFSADDGVHGRELWRTNGTVTEMVADLNPEGSSSPDELVELGGDVFFTAVTPEHGEELWKTDGTESGTTMVRDIEPGDRSSAPTELVAFNGEVWFSADEGVNGRELWRSDGTFAGTTVFDDLVAGSEGIDPERLTAIDNALGNLLVFSGETEADGREVYWLVAGETTVNTLDFNDADDTNPQGFVSVSGEVYYVGFSAGVYKIFRLRDLNGDISPELLGGYGASAPVGTPAANPTQVFFSSATEADPTNSELYRIAGGTPNIEFVEEINPAGSARINQLVPFKTGVMFRADDGSVGTELWVSDGTEVGTRLVEDLYPGVDNHSVPSRLTPAGANHVVFQAVSSVDRELWVSDGTAGGTFLVADINPTGGSNPSLFQAFSGNVYFAADSPTAGRELFRGDPTSWTEGATDNVVVFADINSGTSDSEASLFTALGDKIFSSADDGVHGREPVLIDPVARTSTLIKDILPGDEGSEPYEAVSLGDTVVFASYDEDHGTELWFTDGTEAGTEVLDLVAGPDSSSPSELFAWNGLVLFNAEDDVAGSEPWVSDGTLAGTERLADISPAGDSYPDQWVSLDDRVAFVAEVDDGEKQLFLTDGTPSGTSSLFTTLSDSTEVGGVERLGDQLIFIAGGRLWVSDGTEAGSSAIGPDTWRTPDSLTTSGDFAYFVAEDDDSGDTSVWVSDGTAPGTKEIMPLGGDLGTRIEQFAPVADSSVVFTLYSDVEGEELYVSDGTADGTGLLEVLNPGPEDGPDDAFVSLQDRVFFSAADGESGVEWWTTDGTTTARLADAFPGPTDGTDRFGDEQRRDGAAAIVGDWFIARTEGPGLGTEPWFVKVTPSVPDAPTDAIAALASDTSATVSWSPSPDEPSAPVTGYEVISEPGGHTCSTTGATSCLVGGLDPGESYTFTVIAVNSSGESAPSAQSNAVVTPVATDVDAAARFVPLSPQRLFDTRDTEPAPGPKGVVAPGTTIDVQIAGVAGIPNDAVAVVMNLTVTDTAAPGFVTAYPAGTERPDASSINIMQAGQVRPNLVTVLIGEGGKVSLFSLSQAHLLGDVAGYYIDQDAATAAGRFVPITPQRLIDTREDELDAPGPKGKLMSGETIVVDALNFDVVPGDDVAAIVINITGTQSDAPGFITAFPTGVPLPTASNINLASAGATAPNLAIVPVGDGDQVSFFSLNGVHLLADVTGYITGDGSPSTTAGLFVPLEPTRVFDTREEESPPGPKSYVGPDSSIDATVAGAAGIPADASGVVLNVVGIDSPVGFLTAWNTGPPRPNASTLNFAPPVDTRANAAMLRVGDGGMVSFYTLNGSDILADTAGYFLG